MRVSRFDRKGDVIASSPQGDVAIQTGRRIPSRLDRRVALLLAMTNSVST